MIYFRNSKKRLNGTTLKIQKVFYIQCITVKSIYGAGIEDKFLTEYGYKLLSIEDDTSLSLIASKNHFGYDAKLSPNIKKEISGIIKSFNASPVEDMIAGSLIFFNAHSIKRRFFLNKTLSLLNQEENYKFAAKFSTHEQKLLNMIFPSLIYEPLNRTRHFPSIHLPSLQDEDSEPIEDGLNLVD